MVHVAVIGAGIIGAALADALVRRGASVTVLDSGEPGAGTSGWSLAWLNANEKLPRHYHELSVRGVREWRGLAHGLPWHVPTGSLAWAETDAQREALGRRLERLRGWDYPAEEISVRRAGELEPALRIPRDARVAYFSGEAFLDGTAAVGALLDRAVAGGARLVRGEVAVEVRGSGVAGARLPDGEVVRADVYVCCTGRRAPRLLEPLGFRIPLIDPDEAGSPAPCPVSRTSGGAPIGRVVNAPRISMRPLATRGLQLEVPVGHDAENVLAEAAKVIDHFDAGEVRRHVCVRPLPVDGHPIVGWLPGWQNVYVSVTHSGMTLAAVLARLAAAEVVGGGPGDELRAYRPDRFADGA